MVEESGFVMAKLKIADWVVMAVDSGRIEMREMLL